MSYLRPYTPKALRGSFFLFCPSDLRWRLPSLSRGAVPSCSLFWAGRCCHSPARGCIMRRHTDYCLVCHEEVRGASSAAVVPPCRGGCRYACHTVCMQKWRESVGGHRCMICRRATPLLHHPPRGQRRRRRRLSATKVKRRRVCERVIVPTLATMLACMAVAAFELRLFP